MGARDEGVTPGGDGAEARRTRFAPARLVTLEALDVAAPRVVKFQDVDAVGTVFFPRVLEYFADAYMAWLDAGGLDLARALDAPRTFAPIAHAEVDYRAPLRFGDRVLVEIVDTEVGGTSFALGYRARTDSGTIAAIGHTVHVTVDAKTFRPTAVPDELRAVLLRRPRAR